ncbi:TolC family protein [Edaphobacter paludis]|uniref:TolC family protein n=1 Tax=Edaphobacter paludis TaxID=3035702 RepID=A0AAU7DBG4_9BACT
MSGSLLAAAQVGAIPEASSSGAPVLLTRAQAETIALANNPRIHIGQLLAKVQHQVVRETRSSELPDLSGNLTAVKAEEASRMSAGSLTASRLLEHAGMGVQLNQLITDFGHTQNLVASAKLNEKARLADAEASREDIILATDQVFYQAIEAEATLKVAEQTVSARQTLVDQVSALTLAKLKSDLDLSFAQVNLSQAKLLQLDAQNNFDAAKAALDAVLGYDSRTNYSLVAGSDPLAALPPDVGTLIASALQNRPDLQSLQWNEQAARKYSRAQHEQLLPTISALGVVGKTPVGSSQYFPTDWYGAVGVNMSVPIFNGFRYSAEASQASLEAKAAAERTRDLRDQVVRDVRTAWLNANTALQRVTVTGELMRQANLALNLAQTRYQLGLSSIVELSQAQLQQTQAAIGDANARSQYGFAMADLRFQTGRQP